MAPPHGPGHTDASRGRAGQDVLLAAQGHTNVEITRRPDTTEWSVSNWRRRWCEEGPAGSDERPRPGRPRSFPAAQVAEIKALVCELPAESGRPLSRWSHAGTAREAAARRIVSEISGITVWRYPAADAIRSTEAWRNSELRQGEESMMNSTRVIDCAKPGDGGALCSGAAT